MKNNSFTALDFFCGAGGMSSGFSQAKVEVLAGIDIDGQCKETYEYNHPKSKFIHADIKKLKFAELEKFVPLRKKDDQLIFIGCSPCQYFSTIKTNKSKSEDSKNLLKDFQRFVQNYLPGYVVVENVPGILKSPDSPLKGFLSFLEKNGYTCDFDILQFHDYGIPQTRKRFVMIASRVNSKIRLPEKLSNPRNRVADFISPDLGFMPLKAGHRDPLDLLNSVASLSEKNLERLKMTHKNGGNRLSYYKDKSLANPCHYKITQSFRDTYGRMSWEKPAPTITTKFISISNGKFAHPDQNRGLSLREGAILQTFDPDYQFYGSSLGSIARQIGNAVPPLMAKKIAEVIVRG